MDISNNNNDWVYLGDLHVWRYGHSMMETSNGVMVVGGYNEDDDSLDSIESLDWQSKQWTEVTPSLKSGRYSFGGALEVPAWWFSCQLDTTRTTG